MDWSYLTLHTFSFAYKIEIVNRILNYKPNNTEFLSKLLRLHQATTELMSLVILIDWDAWSKNALAKNLLYAFFSQFKESINKLHQQQI